MKRTDQERIARELGRVEKKAAIADRRASKQDDLSVGAFARRLSDVLMHDGTVVYNIGDDDEVLECVMDMNEHLTAKQRDAVFKKAVKSTGVKESAQALDELQMLADM